MTETVWFCAHQPDLHTKRSKKEGGLCVGLDGNFGRSRNCEGKEKAKEFWFRNNTAI